jgi:serine/threonine protein kinase
LGRYRIEGELGRGGMGVVYACTDEALGRRVAVKTLNVGLLGRDREARMRRFQREVKALSQLDHRGILHIYDAGEADEPAVGWVLYYAMELIEGETLSECLIRGGAMDQGQACAVVARCAEALGAAHARGIVHRDVKPANIFLAERGRVVVADFGVCKIEGTTEITRKDQMVGTPSYLAPEQILGLPVDARTDVFALGALLYVLISNSALRPQLDRAGLSRLAATNDAAERAAALQDVPGDLRLVLARALARDSRNRFVDGTALADALEPYSDRIPAPFESPAGPLARQPAQALEMHSAFTEARTTAGLESQEGAPPPAMDLSGDTLDDITGDEDVPTGPAHDMEDAPYVALEGLPVAPGKSTGLAKGASGAARADAPPMSYRREDPPQDRPGRYTILRPDRDSQDARRAEGALATIHQPAPRAATRTPLVPGERGLPVPPGNLISRGLGASVGMSHALWLVVAALAVTLGALWVSARP